VGIMADSENVIGIAETSQGAGFHGVDTTTGLLLEPLFPVVTDAVVDRACALADSVFDIFRETAPQARATSLKTIAERIEAIGDPLIECAMAESGLPRLRLEGHPAHPGTSALAAAAIHEAVQACDLPEGMFSLVQGPSNALGALPNTVASFAPTFLRTSGLGDCSGLLGAWTLGSGTNADLRAIANTGGP